MTAVIQKTSKETGLKHLTVKGPLFLYKRDFHPFLHHVVAFHVRKDSFFRIRRWKKGREGDK